MGVHHMLPENTDEVRALNATVSRLGYLIGEFIRQAPPFPGDVKLAEDIGKSLGSVEGKIADLRRA